MFKVIAMTPMLLALAGPAAAQIPHPLDPNCERLLPVAVVAKASGDTGVSVLAPGTISTADNTCNYAIAGKTVILSVDLKTNATARNFQSYMRIFKEGQQAIPGLGDEAVVASLSHQDVVVARKGTLFVTLVGTLDLDQKSPRFGKPHLTRPQLIELARQMLAKA